MIRAAALGLALAGCGPTSARGALERELVAQRQQLRALEAQAAGCESAEAASALYRELSSVLGASAGMTVERSGGEVWVRLAWSLALVDGQPSIDAELLLDVVAGALARHDDLDAEVLVEVQTPTSAELAAIQLMAEVLHGRFAAPWERIEAGVARRPSAPMLAVHFVPRPPDADR